MGFWLGTEEIETQWAAERTFTCTITKAEQDKLMTSWAKAIGRSQRGRTNNNNQAFYGYE